MRFHATNENTNLTGRTVFRDSVRYLGYSGTSIQFRFHGTKSTAHILSNPSSYPSFHQAWLAVYIDNSTEPYIRFPLTEEESDYVLYEGDTPKDVTITIMKYSEPEYAACGIAWIETDSETLLPLPPKKKRKILMIGDSITCGYGVEGSMSDMEHKTEIENPAKAYSLLTANALHAEPHIVAWNGKGVITQYIGEEDIPDSTWLVPMLYDYVDAGLERDYFHLPEQKWERFNTKEYTPDIITIYLGTNDASYTKDVPARILAFKKGYYTFLKKVHHDYKHAPILCMLGTMDRRLCEAVHDTVKQFRIFHPGVKISYLSLPMQEESDGLGTFWHPSPTTHQKVADLVTTKIKKMMHW